MTVQTLLHSLRITRIPPRALAARLERSSRMNAKPTHILATLALAASLLTTPAAQADESGNEALLLGSTRQITFAGLRAGEGYFSTDGAQMVFQSERDPANPFFQIFLMDMETGRYRARFSGHRQDHVRLDSPRWTAHPVRLDP